MTGHQPAVELSEAFPSEVEAGADLEVRVRGSCPEGCDLRGALVSIASSGKVLVTSELGEPGTDQAAETTAAAETAGLVLKAPAQVGETAWTITFPRLEVGGIVHEESALTVTATIVPHATSVATWGVPSPVRGSQFTVKVGVTCSAQCGLGGQLIEVRDEAGVKLGVGRLGDDPRPGTTALHEAEVSLVAPSEAGVYSRSVGFVPTGLELPHLEASGNFTFRSVEPPEHTVTVQVVPKGIDAPMANIEVRLGPYRAETNERGLAKVGVPKGTYELSAWRVDLEPVSAKLEVTGDASVEVEAAPRIVVDEDAERYGM